MHLNRKGTSKKSDFCPRKRKRCAESHNLHGVNTDSSTELTPTSDNKYIFRDTRKKILLIFLCSIFVMACTSAEKKLENKLINYHSMVQDKLIQLKQHMDSGRLKNATLLEGYAKAVRSSHPDLKTIVDTLAADATASGPLYQSLLKRLADAKSNIPQSAKSGVDTSRALVAELNAINTAANLQNFNVMLTDPINVLADMSEGKLSRIGELVSEETESPQSQVLKGSELIGNPTYGQWQTNRSGSTFWEFYGQYALFSSLFNNPISYSHWSTHRRSSYYHDIGRNYYSSPTQKSRYQQTEQRVKKQFAKQGKTFQSPYSRKVSVKQSPHSKSKGLVSGPKKFSSAYSKSNMLNSRRSSTGSSTSKPKFSSSSTYKSRSYGSSSRSFGSGGK